MSPIGPISPLLSAPQPLNLLDGALPKGLGATTAGTGATPPDGFGRMLDGLVASVDAKQTQAAEITKQVLVGDSSQLHQSVIAMQEASVSFSLMVEVRNKLIDSYQELMRMSV